MLKICPYIFTQKKGKILLVCLLWTMFIMCILPNATLCSTYSTSPPSTAKPDSNPWNAFVLQRLHSKERQQAIERMHQEYAQGQERTQRLHQKYQHNDIKNIHIDSNRLGHKGAVDIDLSEKQIRMLLREY